MPTVFRVAGLRFYFFSHEPNEPAHVHIDRAGATAEIWLDPVSLARSAGFAARGINELLELVRQHKQRLMEAWHVHFGTDSPGGHQNPGRRGERG